MRSPHPLTHRQGRSMTTPHKTSPANSASPPLCDPPRSVRSKRGDSGNASRQSMINNTLAAADIQNRRGD
ncbi:hypothetical protein KCP70_00145 [Salmonella enterica subsp. enterica]|nr:hypothetical protein KCP70_00145 [Salmonella enterica subsp. enterica]